MRRIVGALSVLSASVMLSGCVGFMLDGSLYSLSDGVVLPLEIETSFGRGKIGCVNPKTGEQFSGTYTGVSDGAVGHAVAIPSVGRSSPALAFAGLRSRTATAIATMIGDKGTVLDCTMAIEKGWRPHGLGSCTDNNGQQYRLQF